MTRATGISTQVTLVAVTKLVTALWETSRARLMDATYTRRHAQLEVAAPQPLVGPGSTQRLKRFLRNAKYTKHA